VPKAHPYTPPEPRVEPVEAPDVPSRLGGELYPTGELVVLPLVLSGKAMVALQSRAALCHMTVAEYVVHRLDLETP